MTRFYLITGFLGSGKTTFLKNILNTYATHQRIAIIQNEFAGSGTDGEELERTGQPFKLQELNNGSVFCVCMLGTFIQTLKKVIAEDEPDMIFLESSGLADPINILELLQDPVINQQLHLAQIITIVDAPHFTKGMQLMTRYRHQVMVADRVMINKTDVFPGDFRDIYAGIKELNPFAKITETSFCQFDADEDYLSEFQSHKAAAAFGRSESGGRPDVKVSVLRIQQKISMEGLEAFIWEIKEVCFRIKGFVNTTEGNVIGLQVVFGSVSLEKIASYVGPSEMIAFSESLTPKALRNKFLSHTNI